MTEDHWMTTDEAATPPAVGPDGNDFSSIDDSLDDSLDDSHDERHRPAHVTRIPKRLRGRLFRHTNTLADCTCEALAS